MVSRGSSMFRTARATWVRGLSILRFLLGWSSTTGSSTCSRASCWRTTAKMGGQRGRFERCPPERQKPHSVGPRARGAVPCPESVDDSFGARVRHVDRAFHEGAGGDRGHAGPTSRSSPSASEAAKKGSSSQAVGASGLERGRRAAGVGSRATCWCSTRRCSFQKCHGRVVPHEAGPAEPAGLVYGQRGRPDRA